MAMFEETKIYTTARMVRDWDVLPEGIVPVVSLLAQCKRTAEGFYTVSAWNELTRPMGVATNSFYQGMRALQRMGIADCVTISSPSGLLRPVQGWAVDKARFNRLLKAFEETKGHPFTVHGRSLCRLGLFMHIAKLENIDMHGIPTDAAVLMTGLRYASLYNVATEHFTRTGDYLYLTSQDGYKLFAKIHAFKELTEEWQKTPFKITVEKNTRSAKKKIDQSTEVGRIWAQQAGGAPLH